MRPEYQHQREPLEINIKVIKDQERYLKEKALIEQNNKQYLKVTVVWVTWSIDERIGTWKWRVLDIYWLKVYWSFSV